MCVYVIVPVTTTAAAKIEQITRRQRNRIKFTFSKIASNKIHLMATRHQEHVSACVYCVSNNLNVLYVCVRVDKSHLTFQKLSTLP